MGMNKLETYIGIEPFNVLVDDSPRLRELVERARLLKCFEQNCRLRLVKKVTRDAMLNAWEEMKNFDRNRDISDRAQERYEKSRDIVINLHPLSYALENRAGCCRYQSALFFVLSYEADLGDQHFIQSAPVNARLNTVFNEVVIRKTSHFVSIFKESLKNKSLDYLVENPHLFEQPLEYLSDCMFYSYHRTDHGLVLVGQLHLHRRYAKVVE